MNFLYH